MTRRKKPWRSVIAALLAIWVTLIGPGITSRAEATIGIDDYPYAGSTVDDPDPWQFAMRECTSFVAWRIRHDLGISDFSNSWHGGWFGNAVTWADNARNLGLPVDGTPTRGSVAYFPPGVAGVGDLGHVAFVMSVGSGTVTVEDYNYMSASNGNTLYNYGQHTVSTAGLSFIHFTPAPVARPDLFWYRDNTVSTISSDGWGSRTLHGGMGKPDWAGVGDFTGDGRADVIWYESWKNNGNLYLVDGATGVGRDVRGGLGKPDWAGVGDFTGDGRADLIWYEHWKNNGNLYLVSGADWSGHTVRTGMGTPTWAGVGDFTGDGLADIAWYESWKNNGNIFLVDGNGFTGHDARGGLGKPDWAGVGDFTGDGRADLIWYESWKNNGNLYLVTGADWSGHTVRTNMGTPTWAGAGDFTGDGLADIAWYESWKNNGNIFLVDGNGFTGKDVLSNLATPSWAGLGSRPATDGAGWPNP